jgi:dephospho-CoA kinase
MQASLQWVLTVASGVTVAVLVAIGRLVWKRTRVPIALSRSVDRHAYVDTILHLSQAAEVRGLEVFAPQLFPSAGDGEIAKIQKAWAAIRSRGDVKVVTGTSQNSLTAAAELLEHQIEVRIPRVIESEELSYHLFDGDPPHLVVNYRDNRRRNFPVRLEGVSPMRVFRSNFAAIWENAAPYESVMAEKILDGGPSLAELGDRVRDTRAVYKWNRTAEVAILTHVAFRSSSPVIFIVGLPGAGKSLVRRRLVQLLNERRFQTEELSDYVYAFRDFIHGAILLDETRGHGFFAEEGGAFRVDNEVHLRPALKSLAERVWSNRQATKITIVEFARSDTLAALREFGDEILFHSQVIHVRADKSIRESRLHNRVEPPTLDIARLTLSISVSDDHRLPSSVAHTLYDREDLEQLLKEKPLNGRIFQIENNDEDADYSRIDQLLAGFMANVAKL